VTRAKAAATETTDLKRTKSTITTTTAAVQSRKRAALGDVSNVQKNDLGAGKLGGKKILGVAQESMVTKASQPTKVMKRSQSTRSVISSKTKISQTSSELKRPAPASGSGGSGHVSKKRQRSVDRSTTKVDVEVQETENIAPSIISEATTVKNDSLHLEAAIAEPLPATPKDVEQHRDLDEEDIDDPLMVAEYVHEIFEYYKELEPQTMANPKYMNDQPDLEWHMRGILVDWLLEVHQKFRLLPETLFLAVNLIDRFLSHKVVQLDRLQLVGVTALFIASKYEEVLSPHVTNFSHVADNAFTEEEILSAERFVLTALNYDISRYPNPMNFLRRISKADDYDVQTRTLGKYLLEISCLDHRFIGHPPSQISAAAMYLARLVLNRGEWVCHACT
jgi:hypothetical protein